MDHFCTYFDRGFLAQGLALADSLRLHAPESTLWVLALDAFTADFLAELRHPQIRSVELAEVERTIPALAKAKGNRSMVEYYFTLSPCWPLYLLEHYSEISCVTYLDADMFWFNSPQSVLEEMRGASVLITEHRHPEHLQHHRRFGRFNVGLLAFRRDEIGLACLRWWSERCLEWCYDRVEGERYADQKYLDEWPERFGPSVRISRRLGVNLAPWNWTNHRYEIEDGAVLVNGEPLELFHFARFHPELGDLWFQSGQLEYGVMPWSLRQAIYGVYWKALHEARGQIRRLRPDFDFRPSSARGWHRFWRALLPRLIFGSDWLRIGPYFISGRFGLGKYSGKFLSWSRHRGARGSAASAVASRPIPSRARR
ncbi:MAG TPA: hypothetical protein VFT72_08515 [Opitutaceae bacterium]|nr:hypothetical protein [Opitutaceae bacterium]